MAKDFTTNLSANNAFVAAMTQATQDTTESAGDTKKARKPRKTYSEKQTKQLLTSMETRGRKGIKLPRINVALRPDLLDYLKIMSESCGYNMTEYINILLEADKKKNDSLYRKTKSNRNRIFAASVLNGDDTE